MTPLYTSGGEERSGMGFTIMGSFTDRLRVRSLPGRGTTVTMRKRMTLDGVDYNADETATWVRKTWVNRWTGHVISAPGIAYMENELSKKFNKVDFSIPLAVSYEYKNFQVEARYNLGLTKVMKEDPESSKHSVFLFTLGYKINLDND